MLTQTDLRSIESIVKPIVDKAVSNLKNDIISEVGEMVEENILPQFTQLRTELLTQLPSKAFIADKLADLEGSVIARQRKQDQVDDSTSSGSLSSSVSINSTVFDGNSILFGTNSRVYEWSSLSTLSSRVSSIGAIYDIVYADGSIWAVDNTNDVVRKIQTSSPYTATSITVGSDPVSAVYDGQYLWVANCQ